MQVTVQCVFTALARVIHRCDLSETSRCVLHVVAYFANGTDPRVMIDPEQSGSSTARPAQEKAVATGRCDLHNGLQ
jgi:hypothetical protein